MICDGGFMEQQQKNQTIKVLHIGENHSIFDSRVFQIVAIFVIRERWNIPKN